MMPAREVLTHITAEPFEPFRLHLARGRTFDVRHPEFIQVGRSTVTVYAPPVDTPEAPQGWEKISLVLIESVSPLGASVGASGQ